MQNTTTPLDLSRYAELTLSAAKRGDVDGAMFWAVQRTQAEDAEVVQLNANYAATIEAAETERLDTLNQTTTSADGERPDYKSLPNADMREWNCASGALRSAMADAGMSEATRIEGAGKYLRIKNFRSFKQATPQELHSLRLAILGGFLTTEWELAAEHESACEPERIDDEDFARILEGC